MSENAVFFGWVIVFGAIMAHGDIKTLTRSREAVEKSVNSFTLNHPLFGKERMKRILIVTQIVLFLFFLMWLIAASNLIQGTGVWFPRITFGLGAFSMLMMSKKGIVEEKSMASFAYEHPKITKCIALIELITLAITIALAYQAF